MSDRSRFRFGSAEVRTERREEAAEDKPTIPVAYRLNLSNTLSILTAKVFDCTTKNGNLYSTSFRGEIKIEFFRFFSVAIKSKESAIFIFVYSFRCITISIPRLDTSKQSGWSSITLVEKVSVKKE